MSINLDPPYDSATIEGTNILKLDFTKLSRIPRDSLVIPVAVQDAVTREVILIAYTNAFALDETIKKRKLILWSTSRNELWFKGDGSGNTFTVHAIYVNCEQNSLVYQVTPDKGNICHTSVGGAANNCYYRRLDLDTLELVPA
ncbi:MAG: phosphoribosyl-AMP cyclohydrolase [Firmicutes bacterium]|nr:phosphoribosyl-AMP cyclohydrolase [Bacillota bacterium]